MLRKWLIRARIVLLLICLIYLKQTKTELYRTGCLFNSDLCDKDEFCYNDNYKGICLQDSQLSSNEDKNNQQNTNDNILNNLNDEEDEREDSLNNNLKDKVDEKLSELNDDDILNIKELTDNTEDDELRNCLTNSNSKYKKYKQDINLDSETYLRILKALCDDSISNGNEPKIPLTDDDKFDPKNYLLSYLKDENEKPDFYKLFTEKPNEYQIDFVDSFKKPKLNDNLDDNLREINQNLNEAEILSRDNIDKKLDRKKPGPKLDLYKVENGFQLDEDNDYLNKQINDNKFNDKRFDKSRFLNEDILNDDKLQSDTINNNNGGIFKRKFGISNLPPKDHKPVEEGAVHVELNPDKKIQLVEPTEQGEKGSQYVAVDSSFAYIYFIKYPKKIPEADQHPLIQTNKELMAQDDILARRYFVESLEKLMSLPKGSFSDIKLNSAEKKKLSDCVPFLFMKYLVIFDNDDENCKLLTASFKVNPNSLQLNASVVADQVEKYKDNLQKETGLNVIQTGIGDKVKIERNRNCNIDLLHTFINLSLCAIAAILIVLLVVFYQRKESLRQKIYNAACSAPVLVGWFGEKDYTACNLASKPQKLSKDDLEKQALDYQDLCRQRIKSNENNKKSILNKEKIDDMKLVYQASNNNSPTLVEKCKTQQKSAPLSATNDPPLISTAINMDITTGHLILEYMENHLKQNGDKLNKEWYALCNLGTDDYLESTQNAAKLALNKNRYPNDPTTWAFDNSRVLLNDLESKDQIDYINASTIIDSDPNPIYIATQGPMKDTISDFWQMVWEQGSSVIVMLTRLVENNVEQSARYWPEKGSETYLHYEVNLVSEHIWSEQYLVRSLYLKNQLKNKTRTVTQFHYMAWPENSVPSSTASLLEFRRKVNKSYREKSSPIIVHCNDGSNRTGAYCLIDMVLNRLTKGVKEIDLSATLEHLRLQRPGMVRKKEQFEFCLRAIAEEVHNLLRSLQK